MSIRANNQVALIGNPNSGKSSLFNYLTGLSQSIGNYPGATVEKKSGVIKLPHSDIIVTDLPGTYSLYPTAKDDQIVVEYILHKDRPDAILYVVDLSDISRQLILLTQLMDLQIPIHLVLTMSDLRSDQEVEKISRYISDQFGVGVTHVSVRKKKNFNQLTSALNDLKNWKIPSRFTANNTVENNIHRSITEIRDSRNVYESVLTYRHHDKLSYLSSQEKKGIKDLGKQIGYSELDIEVRDIENRFNQLDPIIRKIESFTSKEHLSFSKKLDAWVTHPIFGPILFFIIMLLTFQLIFAWSEKPMEWIESLFGWSSSFIHNTLPDAWYSDLLANGIISGLGGIFVFIPQIALLFFIIVLLEESGYMTRVVYLFDPLMRRFGLSGRSLIAMISSGACAIPAIMSTRTIKEEKQRLNTILVSPLISCSARLPVYTVLIGLMVPAITVGGFSAQGLVFMAVYLVSIISTLIVAWVIKTWMRIDSESSLLVEMPIYRRPVLRDILLTVFSRVKIFIIEAGKIILIISIILWFLASFGPGDHKHIAKLKVDSIELSSDDYRAALASSELEHSYIGILGKWIEPAIEPLGYDWKIGIALITSFAAREVFVSTMATIYSIGQEGDEKSIRQRMREEINPKTGKPVYSLATSLSLLIFYLFAMQCMSTVAVVKRETGGWKWPIFQFIYMTVLAVVGAFIAYQILK